MGEAPYSQNSDSSAILCGNNGCEGEDHGCFSSNICNVSNFDNSCKVLQILAHLLHATDFICCRGDSLLHADFEL